MSREHATRWPAPAKLNLFLRVVGARRAEDGRHELQTAFQLLDFGDEVELTPRSDGRIVLEDPPPGLPAAHEELSVRAASLLQREAGVTAGASIRLTKRIPQGAGLGGGSSDAATTLVALNHLWNAGLDRPALAALGLELGADIPIFVHGHGGWAEGAGERIEPARVPPRWYLVAHPRISVSTAEVFADPGLTRDGLPLRMNDFLAERGNASAPPELNVEALLAAAGNDCEAVVRRRHPEVDAAFRWLAGRTSRAEWARMTGTGSAVFGVFRLEGEAHRAARELPAKWDGWVARGVDESPLRSALRAAAGGERDSGQNSGV